MENLNWEEYTYGEKTLIELLITLVIFIFGACVVEFCFSYFSGDGVSTNKDK